MYISHAHTRLAMSYDTYLCVYVHVFDWYIYKYMRTYIHTCVHAYMQTYMHACIHTHAHLNGIPSGRVVSIYICLTHVYIHTCIHTFLHAYIHPYKHTYMHACIHTHAHLHGVPSGRVVFKIRKIGDHTHVILGEIVGLSRCNTYEWVMSHIWMSHVTHIHILHYTYPWDRYRARN